jgi:hypothetical protein
VINEILANPELNQADWIELHNSTDQALNLGGWFLSDDIDDLTKYEIAPGTRIEAGGFLVVTRDTHFGNAQDPGAHASFALSAGGETVYLHSGQQGMMTGYSESVRFGPSLAGDSWGRHVTSTGRVDFVRLAEPTPDSANALPQVGPIVISEIMYQPAPFDAEYIELVNVSDANVTLFNETSQEGWQLTDGSAGSEVLLDFPVQDPIVLPPQAYLLLARNLTAFYNAFSAPAETQILVWDRGALANQGQTLELKMPNGLGQWITLDRITYSNGLQHEPFSSGIDPWPGPAQGGIQSLSRIGMDRYGDDSGNWRVVDASPGSLRSREGR